MYAYRARVGIEKWHFFFGEFLLGNQRRTASQCNKREENDNDISLSRKGYFWEGHRSKTSWSIRLRIHTPQGQ
jgi:hypothetical protein